MRILKFRTQILLLLVVFTALNGCRKEDSAASVVLFPKASFFKSPEQANLVVGRILDKFHPGEKLVSIRSISYMHSRSVAYAFVFYRSDKQESNLVIRKDLFSDEDETQNGIGWTGYKCDGSYCDCKVKAVVASNGTISFDCSCSSCYLLTNHGIE